MKKTKFMAFLLMGAAAAMSLTACGDDDDDPNPDDVTPGGGIVTPSGEKILVKSFAGYQFKYDSNNLFAGIDGSFTIDYAKKTITEHDEYDGDVPVSFGYDAAGRVTSISQVEEETDEDGEYYKEVTKAAFAYSGAYISAITVSNAGEELYEGEKETWDITTKIAFNWENGLLKTATIRETGVDEGEPVDNTEVYTYTYGEKNPLSQSNYAFANIFGDMYEPLGFMAIAGMLGNAPASFVSNIAYVETGEGQYSGSYDFSYTLNEDNTIDIENYNTTPLKYTYSAVAAKVQKAASHKLFKGGKFSRHERKGK